MMFPGSEMSSLDLLYVKPLFSRVHIFRAWVLHSVQTTCVGTMRESVGFLDGEFQVVNE